MLRLIFWGWKSLPNTPHTKVLEVARWKTIIFFFLSISFELKFISCNISLLWRDPSTFSFFSFLILFLNYWSKRLRIMFLKHYSEQGFNERSTSMDGTFKGKKTIVKRSRIGIRWNRTKWGCTEESRQLKWPKVFLFANTFWFFTHNFTSIRPRIFFIESSAV